MIQNDTKTPIIYADNDTIYYTGNILVITLSMIHHSNRIYFLNVFHNFQVVIPREAPKRIIINYKPHFHEQFNSFMTKVSII